MIESSFEHQQNIKDLKNKFEDGVKHILYNTLMKYQEKFFNREIKTDRTKFFDELIEYFKLTEEYEKCDFLNNLKNKIENKKEIVK